MWEWQGALRNPEHEHYVTLRCKPPTAGKLGQCHTRAMARSRPVCDPSDWNDIPGIHSCAFPKLVNFCSLGALVGGSRG